MEFRGTADCRSRRERWLPDIVSPIEGIRSRDPSWSESSLTFSSLLFSMGILKAQSIPLTMHIHLLLSLLCSGGSPQLMKLQRTENTPKLNGLHCNISMNASDHWPRTTAFQPGMRHLHQSECNDSILLPFFKLSGSPISEQGEKWIVSLNRLTQRSESIKVGWLKTCQHRLRVSYDRSFISMTYKVDMRNLRLLKPAENNCDWVMTFTCIQIA